MSNVRFETKSLNGLTYWVCLCDNKVIAQAWSMQGLRSLVWVTILRHSKRLNHTL